MMYNDLISPILKGRTPNRAPPALSVCSGKRKQHAVLASLPACRPCVRWTSVVFSARAFRNRRQRDIQSMSEAVDGDVSTGSYFNLDDKRVVWSQLISLQVMPQTLVSALSRAGRRAA